MSMYAELCPSHIGVLPRSSCRYPCTNKNLYISVSAISREVQRQDLRKHLHTRRARFLLWNLGGRFLSLELTKKQEAFLQGTWIRPFIFFTVIFVATRNLVAAFWVTLLFFFVIWVAANENSPFCMIPSWCGHDAKTPAEIYESNIAALKY